MVASGEKAGQVPDVLANMSRICAERAAATKTRNKAAAVSMMMIFIAVFTVIVFAKDMAGYFDLAFKAADTMGAP